jgi:hypothetical protein
LDSPACPYRGLVFLREGDISSVTINKTMSINESDILSVASRGIYWRTLSRAEYHRAFSIARKFVVRTALGFPIGDKGPSDPLDFIRYYRKKADRRHHYNLAKSKLSRSVNLP